MVVNIMIVMILVACRLVTGEPVEEMKIVTNPSEPNNDIWATIRVLQKQSLEQKGVLQTWTAQQQESAILLQNYTTLLKNYTRDITNIKHVVSGTPFSTCKGETVISFTGTKIKYPATGKYSRYENCRWTIDAGKVTLSFAHFDLESQGMHDYVEIWSGGSRLYRINTVFYNANPDFSTTLDGVITIKFISDRNKEYTGFEMNISAGH